MRFVQSLKNFNIEIKLKRYGIKSYIIHDNGYIDVNGSVDLINMGFRQIPLKFGRVSGSFNCHGNVLETLKNSPYFVGGNFICDHNDLKNLEGGPEEVDGHYDCGNNRLISLSGCAAEIGGNLYCSNNIKLTNLNISSNIVGNIDIDNTNIRKENFDFYGHIGGKIIW